MKVLEVTLDPPKLRILAMNKEQVVTGPTMERAIQAARKAGHYFESINEVQAQINQVLQEQCQDIPNVNEKQVA